MTLTARCAATVLHSKWHVTVWQCEMIYWRIVRVFGWHVSALGINDNYYYTRAEKLSTKNSNSTVSKMSMTAACTLTFLINLCAPTCCRMQVQATTTRLASSDAVLITATLTIRNLSIDDSGVYRCVASHSNGTESSQSQVSIQVRNDCEFVVIVCELQTFKNV